MDSTVIFLVITLITSLICCVGSFFLILLVVGFIVLRRRGKKNVSAREAVNAGVESVSQVFVRGKGGLTPADDDDD
jgi:hypothetical protein